MSSAYETELNERRVNAKDLTELQRAILLESGKAAKYAYAPRYGLDDETSIVDKQNGVWFYANNKSKYEGFVMYDQKTNSYIVSFKGTHGDPKREFASTMVDISKDARFRLIKVDSIFGQKFPFPIDVANGFWSRFKEVFPSMVKALNKVSQMYPDAQRIICTGHSLGGALCTIAAVVMVFLHFDSRYGVDEIVLSSHEAPRSFSAKTVEQLLNYKPTAMLEKRSFRWFREGDIVAKAAPQKLALPGYEQRAHFGDAYMVKDRSSHGMADTLADYEKYLASADNADNENEENNDINENPVIMHVDARGIIKKMKRKKRGLSRSTKTMKDKMAYVRSFKKKKQFF